ncbi:MAG TPA: ATP-binding cassette domain-containing protein [Pyrinomonadaceae bacterium]|nr:ATP-binding cassette domain-containing protein [Pyrinomonadaceae bacterium]
MNVSLRLDGVYAAYKKKEIVRGISLSARGGQSVALIGPNGAGKSTLLKIAAGFLPPHKGRVLIEGRDATDSEPHQRARLGVGYLMQGGRVFHSLTVRGNLELSTLGLAAKEREARIGEIAEMLGLQTKLGTRAGTLSGGWRQCLALAMVLVRRPSILLLDEPSAGLSPVFTERLFVTLDEYRQTHGAAILLVEQNVQAALMFAHRAIALVEGRIADETKRPESWLMEGKLDALFWGRAPEELSLI